MHRPEDVPISDEAGMLDTYRRVLGWEKPAQQIPVREHDVLDIVEQVSLEVFLPSYIDTWLNGNKIL